MKGRAILKYGDDWFSFSFEDELSKSYKIDKLLDSIEIGEIIFLSKLEYFLKILKNIILQKICQKLVDIESFLNNSFKKPSL